MPFTVPWRFCCGGCRLVLGFGAPAGCCCAWRAVAATGAAANDLANLRRVGGGCWFTAHLANFGLESLTVCHFRGLRGSYRAAARNFSTVNPALETAQELFP